MDFQVGDQVVHRVYGLGEIIQMDEKELLGCMTQCYVVRIQDLTLWVNVRDADESSLRPLTPASDFEALFKILSSPGQPLSADRLMRKNQLADQLKDGKLDSVCRTIRDLTSYRHTKKMNDNDVAVLERAQSFLLNEWAVSLSISITQAKQRLNHLLSENTSKVSMD